MGVVSGYVCHSLECTCTTREVDHLAVCSSTKNACPVCNGLVSPQSSNQRECVKSTVCSEGTPNESRTTVSWDPTWTSRRALEATSVTRPMTCRSSLPSFFSLNRTSVHAPAGAGSARSEEHTSELQSLLR